MRKLIKFVLFTDIFLLLFFVGTLLADKEVLRENIVRLHVVGASDSKEDQDIKLQVRDAVTQYLEGLLSHADHVTEAKSNINQHLSSIEEIANAILKENGSSNFATVTLGKEAFPVREYETFSLPSGVYESLRITIGAGEGKNWWCVVFPSLCIPAAAEGVEYEAVSCGFSRNLTNTITGQKGYEVSFFLLDFFGKLENIFNFHKNAPVK